MKLNKAQIKVLSEKIYSEIQEINKHQADIDNVKILKKLQVLYDKGVKILKENTCINQVTILLPNKCGANLTLDKSFENWLTVYNIKTLLEPKKQMNLLSNIEKDIILFTIDSKSVETIVEKIKTKYKI